MSKRSREGLFESRSRLAKLYARMMKVSRGNPEMVWMNVQGRLQPEIEQTRTGKCRDLSNCASRDHGSHLAARDGGDAISVSINLGASKHPLAEPPWNRPRTHTVATAIRMRKWGRPGQVSVSMGCKRDVFSEIDSNRGLHTARLLPRGDFRDLGAQIPRDARHLPVSRLVRFQVAGVLNVIQPFPVSARNFHHPGIEFASLDLLCE